MTKYKVGDLYIIKPMKLTRYSEHTILKFPYNVLSKINLIYKDETIKTTKRQLDKHSNNPLRQARAKIQQSVPSSVYNSAIVKRKVKFTMPRQQITIALKNGNEYIDVFSDKKYKLYTASPLSIIRILHQGDYVVSNEHTSPLSSVILPTNSTIERIDAASRREYNINSLKRIKDRVISESQDKIITFEHTSSKGYMTPIFYKKIKGKSPHSKSKTKIKEKNK